MQKYIKRSTPAYTGLLWLGYYVSIVRLILWQILFVYMCIQTYNMIQTPKFLTMYAGTTSTFYISNLDEITE